MLREKFLAFDTCVRKAESRINNASTSAKHPTPKPQNTHSLHTQAKQVSITSRNLQSYRRADTFGCTPETTLRCISPNWDLHQTFKKPEIIPCVQKKGGGNVSIHL